VLPFKWGLRLLRPRRRPSAVAQRRSPVATCRRRRASPGPFCVRGRWRSRSEAMHRPRRRRRREWRRQRWRRMLSVGLQRVGGAALCLRLARDGYV
jgi:hypothetical protein